MVTNDDPQNLRESTKLLYDELFERGARPAVLSSSLSLIEYTDSRGKDRLLFSTCSDKSSATGRVIAGSKARTALIAQRLDIPIPEAVVCVTIRDAYKLLETYPVIVTKPLGGSGGNGVSVNIKTKESLRLAYDYAKEHSKHVLAQQFIDGTDVRLLIVDGSFVSAVIRKPAAVTGDGISTTLELITQANATAPRNDPTLTSILPIKMQAARRFLGTSLTDIPALNKVVRTTGPANVSLGGSLHEATSLIPAAMIADAEKISKKLDLGLCGVDMMWDKAQDKYYLIEVNATPGIDIHDDPFSGTSSDAVARYVQWLIA